MAAATVQPLCDIQGVAGHDRHARLVAAVVPVRLELLSARLARLASSNDLFVDVSRLSQDSETREKSQSGCRTRGSFARQGGGQLTVTENSSNAYVRGPCR